MEGIARRVCSEGPEMIYSTLDIDLRVTNAVYEIYLRAIKFLIDMSQTYCCHGNGQYCYYFLSGD